MAVRIITDSGFDVPDASDARLTVLPLSITFGDTTYADGVDLTNDRFFELLIESDELPKTSQATPYAYAQIFERVRAAGDEAVVITLSSGLSGTYQSAVTAAADYPEVHVVDSKNVTIGQGVLVQYALRLADEGRGAAEIASMVESARERLVLLALLDTLEYLRRGGRIPKAAADLGKLVNLKPLVALSPEGRVAMAGKAIGRHRAGDALIKMIKASPVDPRYPILPLYTAGRENCIAFLRQAAQAGYACTIDDAISVGPTIGAHVGPGVFGLAYVSAQA